MSGAPMLKAAGLWEKTSAKGNRYLVGRLGGVKVLILEHQDRDRGENDPTHWLMFAEAAEKPRPAAPEARQMARRAIRAAPLPRPRQRPAARPSGGDPRPFDDPLFDIGGAQ